MHNTTYLVDKYSRQAPRYTSYPSALHFMEMENVSDATALIKERNRRPGPVSIYIHIPFCASLCWYCGCTRVITRQEGDSTIYLDHLFSEIRSLSQHLHPENKVVQLHFGGGTPTFLSPDELRAVGKQLREHFHFSNDMEFAVEIDPRRLTEDHAQALAEIGCNRASIGIQDVRHEVQEAINRIQPMEINGRVTRWLRQAGIHNINVDLIYGLPLQNKKSFEETLLAVKTLDPDRFAIFHYAHVPWMMPAQKLLDKYPMPDSYEKFSMLEMTISNLTQSGYEYIGMDHFAKNDDELSMARPNGTLQRNFQGYSTRPDTDIYGFGMSSISQIGDGYLQSVKELDTYYDRISGNRMPYYKEYYLTDDDRIRRKTIMKLMCNLELDFSDISTEWDIDAKSYFYDSFERLQEMADDGLVILHDDGLKVTDTGRMFLRNIATVFDAYYASSEKKGRYSKTV